MKQIVFWNQLWKESPLYWSLLKAAVYNGGQRFDKMGVWDRERMQFVNIMVS